jgi:hypothetical protein
LFTTNGTQCASQFSSYLNLLSLGQRPVTDYTLLHSTGTPGFVNYRHVSPFADYRFSPLLELDKCCPERKSRQKGVLRPAKTFAKAGVTGGGQA